MAPTCALPRIDRSIASMQTDWHALTLCLCACPVSFNKASTGVALGPAHLTTNPTTLSRLNSKVLLTTTQAEKKSELPSMPCPSPLRMGQPIPSMSPFILCFVELIAILFWKFNLVHESFLFHDL